MLVCRMPVDGPGWRVLGVNVAGQGRRRVTVRLVDGKGVVRTHRAFLKTFLPDDRPLVMAGYQLGASELLVSFRPAPRAPGGPAVGLALADRFRLPFGLQAWGVTAVRAVRLDLGAVVRAGGGRVLVRGSLRLTLETPGATFPLHIPFARLLPAATPPGLAWQLAAGVTGLHIRVRAGGRVEGEAVVAVRCEGRPAGAAPLAGLHAVREVQGAISQVAAEHAGPGSATVRGAVAVDIYWLDSAGYSRWTGCAVPFSALLAIEGLEPGDRVEARATVERLTCKEFRLQGLVRVTCTALRSEAADLGGRTYRLDRVAGAASESIAISHPVGGAASGQQEVTAELPLPGPAIGWQEIAAVLASPALSARPGEVRWRVDASLGGTPLDEPPYPAPLRAGARGRLPLEPGAEAAAVPSLTGLSERGLVVGTVVTWGPALPVEPNTPPKQGASFDLPLPGPARRLLDLRLDGDRLSALVALSGPRLQIIEATCAAKRITAYIVMHDNRWQLRCVPDA